MFKKFLLIAGYLLLVIFSPLVLVMLASAAVIFVFLICGENFQSAIQFLTGIYQSMSPYLPYITGIPAIVIAAVFFLRKRKKRSKLVINR